MFIDWASFTPWASLLGGALIGLAAVVMILFNGQVAGISGIVANLFNSFGKQGQWRLFFIIGILISPSLYRLVTDLPEMVFQTSWPLLIVAGLLVGFGTRLGSGCTSGHGVCGLSRLSLRSLVATLTFMVAGFVTVFVVRHWIGG